MEKKFFDVFKTLMVSDDDRELLEETRVTRLVSSSRRDKLHIYLSSDYIIPKDRIYEMENSIRKQYYRDTPVSVKIIEKFTLGSMYSPKAIVKQYRGSLITEASHINPAWTDLLYHADFDFPEGDDSIVLVLEDRFLARDMSEEILDFLDHAINTRCQTSFKISVSYKAKEERKSVIHARDKVTETVRMITLNTSGKKDDGEPPETAQSPETEDTFVTYSDKDTGEDEIFNIYSHGPVTITSHKEPEKETKEMPEKKEIKEEKPSRRRSRQSSNPDVVFGKDFTEGPMNIADIDGDIGEVVIRGEVCDLLIRDTRTGKKMVTFAVTDYTDTIDVKLFPKDDQQERLFEYLKEGVFVLIKGTTGIDKFDGTL
ncbi:MAG: hypothetical protein J5574_05480, partial [Lachnospiraceae bacterium]|nr:hypothetical protein [Lachnospiraceae bacterium]